jgi:methyl-accepting chemotaxis protein
MRIRAALHVFGAALAASVAAAVVIGVLAVDRVRVGGPMYTQIVQGKDLVADILPPPAYVIEAYLEATLALNHSKSMADSRARLKQLHDDYDDRYKYWQAAALDRAIKEKLTQASHAHVTRFWAAVENRLLPALDRNDQADAAQVYAEVTQDYQAHRNVIDAIVNDAEKLNKSVEAAAAQQGSITFWSLAAIIAALFAVLAVGLAMVGRHVINPIVKLTKVTTAISAGNLDVQVPSVGRRDEVGEMANAVLVLRDAAVEKSRLEGQSAEQRRDAEEERRRNAEAQAKAAEEQAAAVQALAAGLAQVSNGDLTVRLSDGFTDTYRRLRDDFNATIERLRATIRSIADSTREVAGTATEISSSTTNLSQRTEEQAASLEETSASMEEISTTVKRNAENAHQANMFTNGTREVGNRGGEVVAQAVKAMSRIEESSRKISDIIGVIDEIARQTNLLALNAAVEAARAGDAGRGFAVVASEVRSLAQRSSQAAKDIKDLITNSSSQVQEGVALVNKAGASLTEIVESIEKVAEIVSEIARASGEQAAGIDQVKAALSQMDQVTQQNSALVEQNAAAAKALEQQSQGMAEGISVFQVHAAQSDGKASAPKAVVQRPAAEAARRQRPAATPKRQPAAPVTGRRGDPVGRMQAALATALDDDPQWKEF